MSLDEWASLPEDEPGELVDGQLVEEEVADNDHEGVISWLIGALRAWIVRRGGFVLPADSKLALRPGLGRKPDVSVYFPGGTVPPRRGPGRAPPDVCIEVISSSARDARRDRIEKSSEYAAFGVRFYWLIDPDDRTFEVFELDARGRYVRMLGASEGTVEVPGCDGLALDLSDLWAEIDRLG